MCSSLLTILLSIGITVVSSIDISLDIQVEIASSSLATHPEEEITITAVSEEDLRQQLTDKLEALLRHNTDADVTISSLFQRGAQSHARSATKQRSVAECELRIGDTCYWANVRARKDGHRLHPNTTYYIAEEICRSNGSTVAIIPDEDAYREIVTYLRSKIPSTWTLSRASMSFWTGLTVHPKTGLWTPYDAFVKWWHSSNRPFGNTGYKNVYVNVSVHESGKDGMKNRDPTLKLYGVLCSYSV